MKIKFIIAAILIIMLALFLSPQAPAQQIVCTVNTTLDRLPFENQQKLSSLKEELETYISDYDWSENEFGYDLNCELEIAFREVQAVNYEDRYSANLVISNGIDLLYADKRCTFALEQNERLNHSANFHPFASLIDFYLYLILGYEYDKLYELGGDEFYDHARQICISAKSAIQYYNGWDRREELVLDLKSEKNHAFRILLFNYYTGYYFFQEEKDYEQAQPFLSQAVKLIKEIDPDKRERFMELNYGNFYKALSVLKMKEQLSKISQYKPKQ